MGTIVLSPQDCFSSLHNCQNSYLSSSRPEIGRRSSQAEMVRSSQAAMVPSPAVQDGARQSHNDGSSPGDGILPIPPLIRGHATVSSSPLKGKTPYPYRSPKLKGKTLYPYTVRSPQRIRQGSSPPRMNSKIPRTASAILPSPLVGSPPLAENLLKGRVPFKVVQGNRPGNNNDHLQAHKKPNNMRHGVHKKVTNTNSYSVKAKADGKSETLTSTSKPLYDGTISLGNPKEANLRRDLQKINSQKGSREEAVIKTDSPVVTILQRPKTEEAAAELFAKFFQNDAEQDIQDEGMEVVSESESEKSCVMTYESDLENQLDVEELSEPESFGTVNSYKAISTVSSESITENKKDVKACAVADQGGVIGPLERRACLNGDHKAHLLEDSCKELAPWERWAGPSYINSPPPSALPFPRFSKKHLKLTLDTTCTDHIEGVNPDPMSTPPSSFSPIYTSLARQRHLNTNFDAVATATKDLKRILNLDLCRTVILFMSDERCAFEELVQLTGRMSMRPTASI